MTSDDRSLHQLVYQLEAAWNAADSKSFAEAFMEDADLIHILGGYYTGRAAIENGHRMIFGTIYKGSSVRYSVEKIRYLSPEVAIVFLRQYLRFYEAGVPCDLEARPTIIAAKAGGIWRIVVLHNTRIVEAGAPPREDRGPDQHPIKSNPTAATQKP
jgi:uncharacterized protein (TIGR02246 family)